MRYHTKHVLEYALLRCVSFAVNLLPYRLALFAGLMVAWPAFFIFGFRVGTAKKRIRQVLGADVSADKVNSIAWISWRNIVFSAVEMLRIPRTTIPWINSVFDSQAVMHILKDHARSGKGGVIAVPHMGSWELAALQCYLNGLPIFTVTAVQKNALVNDYMNRLRTSRGIMTVARGSGTMKEVLRRLTNGGMLAILPDVRMRTEGLSVPFLGGRANVGKGMAMFARHANVPIFPCIVTRFGWAHHRIIIHDPVFPDHSIKKNEDILRMTQAVLRILEEAIRNEPEQWFWFNKRWILDALKN